MSDKAINSVVGCTILAIVAVFAWLIITPVLTSSTPGQRATATVQAGLEREAGRITPATTTTTAPGYVVTEDDRADEDIDYLLQQDPDEEPIPGERQCGVGQASYEC